MTENTGEQNFHFTQINPTGWTRRVYSNVMAQDQPQRLVPLNDLRNLSHTCSIVRHELRRWLAIRSCIYFDCALGPTLNDPSQQAVTLFPELRNLAMTYNHSDDPESVMTNLLSLPRLRCLTVYLNLRFEDDWPGRTDDDPPARPHPGQSVERMGAAFLRVAKKSPLLVYFEIVPNGPHVRALWEIDDLQEAINSWISRRINWQATHRRAA